MYSHVYFPYGTRGETNLHFIAPYLCILLYNLQHNLDVKHKTWATSPLHAVALGLWLLAYWLCKSQEHLSFLSGTWRRFYLYSTITSSQLTVENLQNNLFSHYWTRGRSSSHPCAGTTIFSAISACITHAHAIGTVEGSNHIM